MKYLNILAPYLGLMAGVSAIPLEERQDVQTVHLTFHAGPAEYSLALPADGSVHQTSESSFLFTNTPTYTHKKERNNHSCYNNPN